jgi:ABC-2 type transport system ATP-binding protein
LRVREGADAVAGALSREAWVRSATAAEGGVVRVEVTSLVDAERHFAGALAATGASVVSMQPEEVTLERAFLELTS